MPAYFTPTPRIRRSPFFDATVAEGAVSFTVYNHMYMPTGYGDPLTEYWRLIEGASMWDVAAERQVEIAGPDAAKLVQALCPRRIDRMQPGQGWYVPICDHKGTLLNDPILLKLAENKFWLSIADNDLLLWVKAVGAERYLDVTVSEPDVSPLALQGPLAVEVMARLFDDSVRELGYFRFREAELDDIPLVLMRSGWSKQGGFELFLLDGSRGSDLWRKVRDAGKAQNIGPGCPNAMERVESGLLSCGGDTDAETNPYEVRLGKYVDLESPDNTIGVMALRRMKEHGIKRHQLGVALDHDDMLSPMDLRAKVFRGATMAGHMTANAWSPRLEMNLGLCLVWNGIAPGDQVEIELADGTRIPGEMRELPFI